MKTQKVKKNCSLEGTSITVEKFKSPVPEENDRMLALPLRLSLHLILCSLRMILLIYSSSGWTMTGECRPLWMALSLPSSQDSIVFNTLVAVFLLRLKTKGANIVPVSRKEKKIPLRGNIASN